MDPLSITASAIAITQVTIDLITRTRSYCKSVKDSPEEIAELLQELESFDVVLGSLRDIAQRADEPAQKQINQSACNIEIQPETSRLPTLQKMLKPDAPLSLCYNEMLFFQTKLTKGRSKVKKSLKWPFEKGEIKAVISRLRNLKSLLDTAIASDHLAFDMDVKEKVTHIVTSLRVAADQDLLQRLSTWFSAPNPSSNLYNAQTKRQQDTGVWLLENAIFLGWKGADFSLLWLHGKAGCGKTILSSTVIQSLIDDSKSDEVVTYFYFDFQTREKQLFQKNLDSVVVQLFTLKPQVSAIVEELYNIYDKGRSRSTIRDTLVMLRRIIDSIAASVYLVVDALDESQDRTSLLEGLREIRSWEQKNLRIFVTSRREPEIEDTLCHLGTDTIPLEESVVDGDILTYVRYQLEHDVRLSKWPEPIREEIETALLNGANGMFRWVVCQLDAVRPCMKIILLRKALQSLPKSLDETYACMLDKIPEEHVEDARRVLSCLICAFAPLAIEEIAETVGVISEGEPYYDVDNRLQEPRDILTICSGLISTTEFYRKPKRRCGKFKQREATKLEGLRLSHFSVKEYMTSDRIALTHLAKFALDERHAHELLASLCVNYLLWCGQIGLYQDPRKLLHHGRIQDKPAFALYAASFWYDHLQAAQLDGSTPLHDECLKMLTTPALLRDDFGSRGARLCGGDGLMNDFIELFMVRVAEFKSGDLIIGIQIENISSLFHVSVFGLDELVLNLLAAGEDVNGEGLGTTCLAAAAFFGHKTTVRLLLDKGAEVNAVVQHAKYEKGQRYSPAAIHCAAKMGCEDIVNMLIAEGADVNSSTVQPPRHCRGKSNTPLEAALLKSNAAHTKIVQVLLDAGADVDLGGHGGSAELLYYPIIHENTHVMSMLLDAGVDPNESDGPDIPLLWAIERHKQQSARLLLERGGNLESIDSRLISILYGLCGANNFLPALKMTLELRPTLNTEKLLFVAAKYGDVEAVEFMLQNGTAPDYHDENGVASLHIAAFTPEYDTNIVELLLDANADVNIHGGLFGSALQAAAMSGKANTVQILLEHGASPDYAGGSYGTALEIAQNRLEDLKSTSFPRVWTGDLED